VPRLMARTCSRHRARTDPRTAVLLEIAAPPGAGKSTVLRALREIAADPTVGICWCAADHAIQRPRRASSTTGRRWLGDPAPVWEPLRRVLFRAPTDAELQDALGSVAEAWDDFLRVVTEGPGTGSARASSVPALDIMTTRWLLESITTRALLEAHEVARPPIGRTSGDAIDVILLDDGLMHPYKLEAAVGRDDPARRDAYLRTVPVPDVLVHLEASVGLIARRLQHRHEAKPQSLRARAIRAAHQGEAEAAFTAEAERLVALAGDIADGMRRRGVPVITVDASATTLAQVDELIPGIRSLLAESLR